MDFLKIRKKAKERARERGAAATDARAPEAAASAPPTDAPVVTDEDVLQGALAAQLQGLPAPGTDAPGEIEAGGADAAPDRRFTTWRPGTGAPPVIPPEPDRPSEPNPNVEEFAVLAPHLLAGAAAGLGAVPVVVAPSPPAGTAPSAVAAPAPALPAAAPDPLDDFFFREDEAAPLLPELAPAERPEAAGVLAREEFLTFLLGTEEYAVAIERVREVVRAPPITEVPRAPAHILGVVTVRGEVVAVVDPRRRLGLPPARPAEGEGKVVIVDAGEGPCGLHVDGVASVVRLRPGSIEPCPQGIAGQRAEVLAGIGRDGDRLFTVLDLRALLRRGPARAEGQVGRVDAGP